MSVLSWIAKPLIKRVVKKYVGCAVLIVVAAMFLGYLIRGC